MPRKKAEKKELLQKYPQPILEPQQENPWEAWQTFNPGVVFLENKIHFLYRAIGHDGVSRFGYANSEDGFEIDEREEEPVFEHKTHFRFNFYSYFSGGSVGGAEDPRITLIDDKLYIFYIGFDNYLPQLYLTSITKNNFLNRRWHFSLPFNISPLNTVIKSGVLFPEKINGKYLIFYRIFPDIWADWQDDIDNPFCLQGKPVIHIRQNYWDSKKIGAGAPPIKTPYGWLLIYYGVDSKDPGKYQIGAMILDLDNPTKVIARTDEPLIKPTLWFELSGHKPGVCYPTGAVIKDDKILIYYGASDSYVGVAWANFDEFLQLILKGKTVSLSKKIVGKRVKK